MGSNTDSPTTDLRNPGRTVHVGVILMKGMTEILDVAPIDYLHGLTSEFIGDLPDEYLQPHYKQQTQDFQFHWVNETGETAKLTGGINLQPTVSLCRKAGSAQEDPSTDMHCLGHLRDLPTTRHFSDRCT